MAATDRLGNMLVPSADVAVKAPVRVATSGGNIVLSGLQTIDGIVLAAGDRVLVKDQTDKTTNGIYNVSTGVWTRAVDANSNTSLVPGMQVRVTAGTLNALAFFINTCVDNPATLGTSLLTFAVQPLVSLGALTLGPTLANVGSQLRTAALTGDITAPANSFVTTVAQIQGTVVSGATGSGKVVFATAPTIAAPVISGGSIDGAPIGAITPAAGTFSALTAAASANLVSLTTQGTITVLTALGAPFGNLTPGTQSALQWQGQGSGNTASFHLNPGPGALPTGTITEFVSERTNLQAFGGNYGRWSYTNLGSSLANASGIVGEFGGTTPIGPYLIQIGIENPPSVFTVFEGWRFQTTDGGSEDARQGTILFGNGATAGRNQITLIMGNIGSPGTRDSHSILWEGKANNGTERAVWWRQNVNVTSNAGVSSFLWQQNLNGGGYTTRMSLSDAGALAVTSLTLNKNAASLPAPLTGTVLQVGQADAALAVIDVDSFGTGAQSLFIGRQSRGTAAAQTATQSGDILSNFAGVGWGAGYASGGGALIVSASQNYTGTNRGAQLDFYTTPNNSDAGALVMRLSNSGGLSVGGTATDPGAGGIFANVGAGIGTTTLTSSFLAMAAGTTAKSQINFAASTAPTTPNNGDFWFDGTNFKARVAGATKTFTIA